MLKKQIQNDLTAALKEGNQPKRSALGMLLTAIQNKELEKRTKLSKTISDASELAEKRALTEEEVVETVMSEVKKRKDAINQFKAGNRNDLADKEQKEIEFFSKYLPEQMGEDELRMLVKAAVKESGASSAADFGKVMKILMPKIAGRANGQIVSQKLKEKLS